MPQGLITSLLIKLTFDFWYFTLLTLIIKAFLIRFTVTDSVIKVFLIWIFGSIVFYFVACISGIIFSAMGFYYIPFIMYILATIAEIGFTSIIFKMNSRRLLPEVLIGDGLFFFLLFMQML
jgi:hypothetical protein